MTDAGASGTTRALATRGSRELSDLSRGRRPVRSSVSKQWQPPRDSRLMTSWRSSTPRRVRGDRLLLRVLWTAARVSEALALRPMDVQWDSLVLPNLKNPHRPTKRVFLPAGRADLPEALPLWAKEYGLANDQPLLFSRKRGADGTLRSISRQPAWEVVRVASVRANVRVLALRASATGLPATRRMC